jgi:dihydrofolate reductase
MGGGANFGDNIKCCVFTRSPRQSRDVNLQFVSGNIVQFVENLKTQDGKNILLMGGGKIAETFFAAELIDEIILGIQPVILGAGIPLFISPQKQIELERIDVKLRKSGTVQISYRVKKR